MQIDGPFYAQLDTAASEVRRLSEIGYDGVYTLEGSGDPSLPLVLASEHAPYELPAELWQGIISELKESQ